MFNLLTILNALGGYNQMTSSMEHAIFAQVFIAVFAIIFVVVLVVVIVKSIKSSITISTKVRDVFKKALNIEMPKTLNKEDKQFCEYCGSFIEKGKAKCASCGAQIKKL
mgnify:CR=1 FL=1